MKKFALGLILVGVSFLNAEYNKVPKQCKKKKGVVN